MTTVQVQVSVNGGPVTSGAVTAAFGDSIQLSATDTSGWTAAKWTLRDYPPGMGLPSGWAQDAQGNFYFQPANPTTPPPVFNWPASGAQNWGKIPIWLQVNNNPLMLQANGSPSPGYDPSLTDTKTVISVGSPNLGMEGIAATETSQWDMLRQWIGAIMRMLRLLDPIATGGVATYLSGQSVAAAGSIAAASGTMTFVDASGGTCTVNPPALGTNTYFGVCDGKKGGSFGPTEYASIPNASSLLEDPNNPGVYTTNPIVMNQPNQSAIWMANPAKTFFKLVG